MEWYNQCQFDKLTSYTILWYFTMADLEEGPLERTSVTEGPKNPFPPTHKCSNVRPHSICLFLGANNFYFFEYKNCINSNTSTPSLHVVKASRSAISLYRE